MARIYESRNRQTAIQGRREAATASRSGQQVSLQRPGQRVRLTGPQSSPAPAINAVNRTAAVREQEAAFGQQLERAGSFFNRSADTAMAAVRDNYAQTAQVQQRNFERNEEFSLRQNSQVEQLLAEQNLNARRLEMGQFERGQALMNRQQQETAQLNRSILDQVYAQRQQVRSQNLEAFAAISDTANKFLTEQVQRFNENEEKIGLMMAAMGNAQPSPEQRARYNQGVESLRSAAAAENQTNERIAQVDIELAENDRVKSPVLKGWRAYGYAVGLAKKAAARAQVALEAFIDDDNATIPDGKGGFVSPRQAARMGPAMLRSALAVGVQSLLESSGVSGLNPMILSEHLFPTLENVQNNIMANRLSEGREVAKKDRIDSIISDVQETAGAYLPNDTIGMSRGINESVEALVAEGIDRGTANRTVVPELIKAYLAMNDADMLLTLAASPVNPDRPELGIWEDRFRGEFTSAIDTINERSKQILQEQQEMLDKDVDDILFERDQALLAAGTDSIAVQTANLRAEEQLKAIADLDNQKAREALVQSQQRGLMATDMAYPSLLRVLEENPTALTADEIDALVTNGSLSPGQGATLKNRLPNAEAVKYVDAVKGDIRTSVSSALVASLGTTDILPEEAKEVITPYTAALSDQIYRSAIEWVNTQLAQGKTVTAADIMGYTQNQINTAIQNDGRFKIVYDKASRRVKSTIPLSNNPQAYGRTVVSGKVVSQMAQAPEISGREELRGEAIRLTPNEFDEIQVRARQGLPQSPKVQRLMREDGQTLPQLLEEQGSLLETPFDPQQLPDANERAERLEIAPYESTVLEYSGISAVRRTISYQRLQQNRVMQDLRQRAAADRANANMVGGATVGDGSTGGGGVGLAAPEAQALRPLLDMIKGPESGAQGYNATNQGTAGDTPEGIQSITGKTADQLTVGEVMKLQDQGTIHAFGAYQIVGSTMKLAVKAAGVSTSDRMTPDIQDRLAIGLLMNGQRTGLSAYLNGTSDDVGRAATQAAEEWAVFKTAEGLSRYAGQGGNRASVPRQALMQMLQRVRNDVRLARARAKSDGGPVYLIDNLGWGSTGPHADVKPVVPGTFQSGRNLPPYRKGTLDNYVDIQLPDGRRGPLSQLSISTDDDAAHRARGSYGHDYAAPKGSKLFLKNGARVIDQFVDNGRGEGSTVMFIELPDGRRFKWLHGQGV